MYNSIHNQYEITAMIARKAASSKIISSPFSSTSSSPSYSSSPWPETPSKPQHSPPGWVGSSPFVPLSAATMERTICHTFLWKPQYFPILFGFTTWNTFATLLCKTFNILELKTRFGLKRLKIIYKEFLVWLFSILHGKDPMQKLAGQLTREREREGQNLPWRLMEIGNGWSA